MAPGADPFERPLDRFRLLRLLAGGVGGAAALAGQLAPAAFAGRRRRAPLLRDVKVTTNGRRFAGDGRLLTTISPEAARANEALVHFTLDERATVELEVLRTSVKHDTRVWSISERLPPGRHVLSWMPAPTMPARTYLVRLTVTTPRGRTVYGGRPVRRSRAPVVRILGVEPTFAKRSYEPNRLALLNVAAKAKSLTVQVFHSGSERVSTNRLDAMTGVPVTPPRTVDWRQKGDGPRRIWVRLGDWPSGLYFAQVTADDGRVGFAPFVLRPAALGQTRVAVVLPTNTWQAYNFRDKDGDGWGDTWYAGGATPVPVALNRPYLKRGVPPKFKNQDRGFIRWLVQSGRRADFLSDDDLEAIASGDELARLYDLVIFPGHSEYMTVDAYDAVEHYRNLGGNLIFLSANNFFWRIDKSGHVMTRRYLWRDVGRPEARVLGVQYLANDNGSRQRPFTVRNAAAVPWLWEGTGLGEGSTFGETVGGFGTELDATTSDSPPGTTVVADIPDLFGPGLTAQMTYYETPEGAKVFSAGVLDFCGAVMEWPMSRMLENLWNRMLQP